MEDFTSRFLRKTKNQEAGRPTKIRCMRRVCVDIEANGDQRCPGYMPTDMFYYREDIPAEANKFEQMHPYMKASNLVYSLNTQDVPMKQNYASNMYRVSELSDITCNKNCVSQETINSLKSVIEALENNRSEQLDREERIPSGLGVDFSESTEGQQSFHSGESYSRQYTPNMGRNSELNALTELVRQTMLKLDLYMATQAEQQANQLNIEDYLMPEMPANISSYMDPFLQMQLLQKLKLQPNTKGKARRTVKVMPVQPLVIMPPQAAPAPVAAPVPAVSRPERYPRQRPRRKRAAPETTIVSKETKRDCGTTMWCPSKSCQQFCGVNTPVENEVKPFTQSLPSIPPYRGRATPNPDLTTSPTLSPTTVSSTPSPGNFFYYPEPTKAVRFLAGNKSPQSSDDVSKEQEFQTTAKRDLEKQLEQQLEKETETQSESQQSEDDWYQSAQLSLLELEKQKINYSKSSCHKLMQTDSCSTISDYTEDIDTSSQCSKCITTTKNKAVNTSYEEPQPVQIVRIYKSSNLKSKRGEKREIKAEGKVRFQNKEVSKTYKENKKEQNPFLLNSSYPKKQTIPKSTPIIMTSSSCPSESKLRVLKTMSEATSKAQQRRYIVKEDARFQRLLEEEHEKLQAERQSEWRSLRCKGGSNCSSDWLPSYPSGWSQLSMME